jgi:hypothetical protein
MYNTTPPNYTTQVYAGNPHGHHLRDRAAVPRARAGYGGPGILPTPDPTVASCISDEDVARTLIALGDASNYSHGRTSNSTVDDTFSGVADAASSTGATSDSDEYSEDEGGLPKHSRYLDEGDDEYDHEGLIKSEYDEESRPTKKLKTKSYDGPGKMHRLSKSGSISRGMTASKPRGMSSLKAVKSAPSTSMAKPSSSTALPGQVRKASSASSLNGVPASLDEDDLSTKPRCQRCRKSKKGCDRQRPCQRCKDAGIGIEGCVSEDEGNGRKGRFGRHMGVSLKATPAVSNGEEGQMLPPMPIATTAGYDSLDKTKKRKRS